MKNIRIALLTLLLGLIISVILARNAIGDGSGNYPAPENGDWRITKKTYVGNETIKLNGNLTIEDEGNLTFRNVTLIIKCSEDGEFGIDVQYGGKFFILDCDNNSETINDCSNITTNNSEYEFKFCVNHGAEFVMKNSKLSECGYKDGNYGEAGLTIKTRNTIIDNSNFYNNYYGIYLRGESNNQIINNTVYSNIHFGIYLFGQSNIKMRGNIINNNKYNFCVRGSSFYYNHDIDSSNTINGKPIIYIVEKQNLIIDEKTNGGYFGFVSCANVTIKNISISNNGEGILFVSTTDSIIENCEINDNEYGIYLLSSSNNQVINNIVTNNYYNFYIYSKNNRIINSTISNSKALDLYLRNSKITLINTTYNNDKVYFKDKYSDIIFNRYLTITVLDKNRNPCPKAKVRIQDNENGTYDENFSSNTKGFVKNIDLTEYIENENSKTYYTPYTITVEKDNLKNTTKIEINQNKEITIILENETNDWIVNQTKIYINETIFLNGNLRIVNGGNLTFKNVTLIMNCSKDGEFYIDVKEGCEFNILDYDGNPKTTNDRSKITANNTDYEFKFLVNSGAEFILKNSELSECGFKEGDMGSAGLTIKTNNVLIDNSSFYNNYCGISFYSSINNTIINNNVSNNTHGIYLNSVDNNNIINNTVYSNTDNGIYIISSRINQIINNTVYNNVNGVQITASSNIQIVNNYVYSNNKFGIYLKDSFDNIVINNRASNCESGIRFFYSYNNTITNNYVSNNNYGIDLYKSTNNQIINSTIFNSFNYDIYLDSNSSITAINTTFDKDKVLLWDEESKLIVKWYLSIEVIDINGFPVDDANILFKNKFGTERYNGTTNQDGFIKWVNLTEYFENKNDGKSYYTPYTINASKDKKFNQTQVFINESKIFIIIIKEKVLEIIITNPKNDEIVKDIVTITAEIKNATNLEFIAFTIVGIELQNSTSNSFEWNTKDYENMEYTIIVTAKDKYYFVWDEIKVTVNNIIPENQPPIITTPNIEEADILEPYSVQYEFIDQDITDTHTWQLKTNTTWLNLSENGNLYGTPTINDIGSYWLNITITDNGTPPLSDYTNFTLVVDDFPDFQTFNNEILGIIVTIKYKGFGTVEIKEPKQPPEPTIGLTSIKFADITPEQTLEIIWANITINYKDSEIPKDQEGKALIDENTLKIHYWENSEWKLTGNNGLDTINKIAWANVSHFTIFALLGEKIPQDIEPKLEIINILFEGSALEGQNITIEAKIKNTCNISISNFIVTFYYDDKEIESLKYEKTLDPNEETSIEITWQAIIGNHTIKVKLETSEGELLDSKESTEKLEVSKVEIVEPKIEITKISFQKQAVEGQNITINATIKNIGNIPISNFTVIFYFGDKQIGSRIFENTLDVGKVTTIEIKWDAILGNHTIRVEVKLGDKVLDVEESTEKLEVIKVVEEDWKEDKEEFPTVFLIPIIVIILIIVAFWLSRGKKAEVKIEKEGEPKEEKNENVKVSKEANKEPRGEIDEKEVKKVEEKIEDKEGGEVKG